MTKLRSIAQREMSRYQLLKQCKDHKLVESCTDPCDSTHTLKSHIHNNPRDKRYHGIKFMPCSVCGVFSEES